MASLAHQFTGLGCPLSSFSRLSKSFFFPKQQRTQRRNFVTVVVASGVSREQKEEWRKLRELFAEAREQCEKECEKALTEDISFIEDDILAALPEYAYNYEIGAKIKGTVFHTEANGAVVEIFASSGYLPTQEACIHKIRNVKEAGIVPGLKDEFKIIGVDKADESFILSLRAIQHDLAWERCSQLQKEDIVVKGKVVGSNKGGLFALVEGLRGFIPFSLISTKLTAEELLDKGLPLKFVEVDAEQSRLVLNHRKAIADTQAQLETGLVVTGTVQSLKPYGAFIDIGGINGLLHVSQISHDRVSDIQTVLQTGDTIKAMVLSHDRQRSRLSLSTKKLEPTPGDMIRNPKIVFEKAEEMAQTFRQRIAQAEAMARADVLRFQPESGLSLNPDGILRPFSLDSLADGLNSSNTPPADNKESEESNF